MAAKRFRDDLYYRINVVEVRIPPLRERAEDIPWLMGQLFERLAAERDPAIRGISALAEQAALLHAWPGNVRELRNRMERAIALNLGGTISPQDLFPEKKTAALLGADRTALFFGCAGGGRKTADHTLAC
jgi:DNA-binding NtrC family response regulator